jgi:mono/diheme cytochrome c family protein
MRLMWATLIMGTGVVAAAGMFSEQARSDDKSAATYKQKCASCYGPDGKGETPAGKALKVRHLSSKDVEKMSDSDFGAIISGGKGKMPPFKTLTSDEVKDLVVFVRSIGKKK